MRDWPDERAQYLFHRMTSVRNIKFDYEQVYHGESILIFFDKNLKHILKFNADLSFHISSDRLFSKQTRFLVFETYRYRNQTINRYNYKFIGRDWNL